MILKNDINSLKKLYEYLKYELKSYGLGGNGSIFFTYLLCPKYRVNVLLRIGEYLYNFKRTKIIRLFIRNRLMIKYGVEIHSSVHIGKGLKIIHFPGVVIHENVQIGENFRVHNGVNIGTSGNGKIGIPKIGDNVYIGTGSKIIGGISIGDNCKIGALSLINKDIPSNSIAYGIPCIVKINKEN